MATRTKWGTLGSKTTAISSSNFNNVADAAQKISALISNDGSSELALYMDVMMKLSASTANRCAGAHCRLYLLPDMGDSNYSMGSSSLDPSPVNWVASFGFDSGVTTARYSVRTGIPIPPENFKLLLENRTGRLFSCCTVLSYRRYYIQST